MKDGSLRMFAELPGLQTQNGSSSKTFQQFLPLAMDTLWPECVRNWPDTVSADGSGNLYERVMSELATDESGGSALLHTPVAREGAIGYPERFDNRNSNGGTRYRLADQLASLEMKYLPTPLASDAKHHGPNMDWEKRKNHISSVSSVLMNLQLEDGRTSSVDHHQEQQSTLE